MHPFIQDLQWVAITISMTQPAGLPTTNSINASYLTIYHGLLGVPLPDKEDIYAIDGLPREVVKAWFSVSFGVQSSTLGGQLKQ